MRQKCIPEALFQQRMAPGGLQFIGKQAEHRGAGAGHFRTQRTGGQHDIPDFSDFRVMFRHHRRKHVGKPMGDAGKIPLLQCSEHPIVSGRATISASSMARNSAGVEMGKLGLQTTMVQLGSFGSAVST